MDQKSNWWQSAVIYQVYPRSLKDSNNDGVGDLPGIVEKLDYIKSLGVDAIWISPFFKSPMKDFGYDISDYREIDPLFGNLEDFDRLIDKAHQLDLKVMIDQVLSHTSDQHQWFIESRENRNNDKADWYVWADAKDDGSPPNNWLSIFGGCAWQWEPRRQQYYLHNFLVSQPDLNFHNPQVQQATLENVEFWLKRGVDGFRLDAINFCFHDKKLRDNPAKPKFERRGRGFSEDNPYAYQYHYFNNTQPENIPFIESLRALLDRYPNTVALGEISSEDSLSTMAEYTAGNNRLHLGYSFELLTDDCSAGYIQSTISQLEQKMADGYPCWAISNHDVARVVSRWGKPGNESQKAKVFSALLFSLRGAVCTYQGEELGLEEVEIPFEQLQDPYGIAFWPTFKGRDGCRTPLPWNDEEPFAGFSEHQPWLPIAGSHRQKSVIRQQATNDSVLNAFCNFLAWRKKQPALLNGDIQLIKGDSKLLIFVRQCAQQKLLIICNLTEKPVSQSIDQLPTINEFLDNGFQKVEQKDNELIVAAFSCIHAEIR